MGDGAGTPSSRLYYHRSSPNVTERCWMAILHARMAAFGISHSIRRPVNGISLKAGNDGATAIAKPVL